MTLAIETSARYRVLRILQWKRVDFSSECLQFKDKTSSGTGRFVPLSPRVLAFLRFWAQQFPDRYGHFNLESLREAVAAINRGEFRQVAPVNSR